MVISGRIWFSLYKVVAWAPIELTARFGLAVLTWLFQQSRKTWNPKSPDFGFPTTGPTGMLRKVIGRQSTKLLDKSYGLM